MENRIAIGKKQQYQMQFFQNTDKIDRPLVRLTKKKKEDSNNQNQK